MPLSRRLLSVVCILIIIGSFLQSGCTSAQLRRSTVAHSVTLSDIYTQQVMNNLAMFIDNPSAIPFFAYPNQGTTQIQDTGGAGGPGYVGSSFATSPFGVSLSRQATENWVLNPVSDPARLALMRCAYQQAVGPCMGVDLVNDSGCPDCKGLREAFYGPVATKGALPNSNIELPCLNSECCWLQWGSKKDVPCDCRFPYVGRHGDLYVWATCDNREMLARLTLAILDYAVNDPVQFSPRTKIVEYSIEAKTDNAELTKTSKITATIPIDQPSSLIASLDNLAVTDFVTVYGDHMAPEIRDALVQVIDGIEIAPAKQGDYLGGVIKGDPTLQGKIVATMKLRHPFDPNYETEANKAITYLIKHGISPFEIPSADLLNGPARFEKKGSASDNIQRLGLRIKAATP